MRLRARLALTIVVATAPLVVGLAWLRGEIEQRDAARALREFATARMESGGRERCEADPAYFAIVVSPPGGPGPPGAVELGEPPPDSRIPAPPPPPEGGSTIAPAVDAGRFHTALWAYGPDLVSRNPRAPPVPRELAAAVADGSIESSAEWSEPGVEGHQLLLRTPWRDGPCAFVFVRRADPAAGDLAAFAIWSAVGVAAAILGVVALAAGAFVGRVRRLTESFGRSAAARYETPVDEEGGDEVEDLARAFNAAGREIRGHLVEIEKREEALRTFLANTTHDVMTPLTVLQGHVSAIRRRVAEGRAVDVETANAAAEEAHYLASLVHNLSAVAKLDAGLRQVQLSPVHVNDLVQRVVERHWPLASPRAIEVSHAVPESVVWFDADLTLLEQAVGNLVGNAVRYNRPGGHVAVLLEEPARGEFSIRVIDDGPGVPDELLARLGQREFRTDDARRRNPEGTGLGLDIVRRVADFHRLKLAFRRSEHGGLEAELRGVRGLPPKSPGA